MEKSLKFTAIVQARLSSSRLPNKVIAKINSKSVIEIIHERLKCSKLINDIIVAIPENEKNLEIFLKRKKIKFFLGSNSNVLERYYKCAKKHNSDFVVRVTADCPLIDPNIIDMMIKNFIRNKDLDLLTNNHPPTYPDGLDISIFTFDLLKKTYLSAKNNFDREHVVPHMLRSKNIKKKNIINDKDLKFLRWTIDQEEDLEVIRNIFSKFSSNTFSWTSVLKLFNTNPKLFEKNLHILRDEGSQINTGQKTWIRAKSVIPGGNMFLSKRPDFYLKNKWPTYFQKAKGCFVWDLDGNKFLDMSMMGIGTNILGYGNKKVDSAVKKAVNLGNLSTLNCKEEVLLSEKLIEIHPWADMCKLTRSGGEANNVAIRIARSFTKRHKIAVCGYHGWHDWYLAANLKKTNKLDNHLMKGINPNGVPKVLAGTIYTFNYNDFTELKKIIKNDKQVGIIKMEVSRNYLPKNNFLKKIRDLCDEKKIILIFDECTSGFRQTFGGLHKLYNVAPDMAIFGKAIGNGYAINAIIGKKEIMLKADNTFLSSTFWSERIGPTAALATLEEMKKNKTWKLITEKGHYIRNQWKKIAKANNIKLKIFGIPAISSFVIDSKNNLKYRTLISQELLKDNILATNTIYLCTKHEKKYMNKYLKCLKKVFSLIRACEKKTMNIDEILNSTESKSFFQRLN